MLNRKCTTAAVALIASIIVSGCNSHDADNLSRDTAHLAQDTSTALTSLTLEGKVRGVLALRKGVNMTGLSITTKDGIVTVTGSVPSRADRRRIVDTINGIRGVDKVQDELTIKPGS